MELVLKTSDGVKPTVSSNLTASANNNAHPNEVGFVVRMQEREIRTIKCNSPVDCCLPPVSTAATPLSSLAAQEKMQTNLTASANIAVRPQQHRKMLILRCCCFICEVYNG